MGQQLAVISSPSSLPGMVRFEANHNLTGQGHEVFGSTLDAVGTRPAAVLARRLFDTGHVAAVHMYSNIVTVDLAKGATAEGLADVVRDMFQYWKPGMVPQAFDDVAPPEQADAPATAAGADGGGADADYLRRVPANLVERSRAALAKWRAAHG
jgi:hypothetical protein